MKSQITAARLPESCIWPYQVQGNCILLGGKAARGIAFLGKTYLRIFMERLNHESLLDFLLLNSCAIDYANTCF